MNTIEVQEHNGIYSCDIDVTKEEWLRILQDENTPQAYKETVLRFFYYPDHRGTCTAISNALGGNAQKLSANVRELGKYVQKLLNRFQAIRSDGTPCFWIIPMGKGKDMPQGNDGTFEWELRSELVEAIKEYLYWYLVERYKELRKEIPIDGDKWTELYKWQLITANKGKSAIDIVRSHVANPKKSELGGFDNLIDAPRDNKPLAYLVKTNPEGLQEALDSLTDESKPLNERLARYKVQTQYQNMVEDGDVFKDGFYVPENVFIRLLDIPFSFVPQAGHAAGTIQRISDAAIQRCQCQGQDRCQQAHPSEHTFCWPRGLFHT